jgi:hypothetical protein
VKLMLESSWVVLNAVKRYGAFSTGMAREELGGRDAITSPMVHPILTLLCNERLLEKCGEAHGPDGPEQSYRWTEKGRWWVEHPHLIKLIPTPDKYVVRITAAV